MLLNKTLNIGGQIFHQYIYINKTNNHFPPQTIERITEG